MTPRQTPPEPRHGPNEGGSALGRDTPTKLSSQTATSRPVLSPARYGRIRRREQLRRLARWAGLAAVIAGLAAWQGWLP